MIEVIAHYPVAHCPCRRSWGLSADGTNAVLLARPELRLTLPQSPENYRRALAGAGTFGCICGHETFRLNRAK